MVRSQDDGRTWTKPENLTRQEAFDPQTLAAFQGLKTWSPK